MVRTARTRRAFAGQARCRSRPRGTGPTSGRPGRLAAPVARRTWRGHRWRCVHRSSDPGHWIVTFPWRGADRAREIAEAAFQLADRNVSPARSARLTERPGTTAGSAGGPSRRPGPRRPLDPRRRPAGSDRLDQRHERQEHGDAAHHPHPAAGRPPRRHHDLGRDPRRRARHRSRRLDRARAGALQILGRRDVDVAVLETARGGILLRGVGYESNDASVLTNVSADHLDLQGIHTLPELAEVKAVIARMTKPDGWVVLNADDPLVAAVARRVRARVAFFRSPPRPDRRFFGATSNAAVVARGERGRLVEWEGGRLETHHRCDRRPDRDRRPRPPQRGQRARGCRRGARHGRVDRGGRRGAARFPADGRRLAGSPEPLPGRQPDRDRRLRPQRGGPHRRARRGRGHRRRSRRPGRPRSRRSSARRATGQTTPCAGSVASPGCGRSGW